MDIEDHLQAEFSFDNANEAHCPVMSKSIGIFMDD